MAQIDVCVATYKRPDLLRKLLRSLVEQETAGRFAVAIRVADNDAQGSAESIVREFDLGGRPLSYGVEPTQNIALARNKSISLASGDYVATTDDDLHADRRWLLTLHDAMRRHGADVVHGPVVPEFAPSTPAFVRDFHVRPNPPTGTAGFGYVPTTANSLFRRALVEGVAAPFDPRFGKSGGEDTDFFNRLRRRGCGMIWCREAVVYAYVPRERTTVRWLLRRSYRNGLVARDTGCDPLGARGVAALSATMARLGAVSAFQLACGVVDRPAHEKGIDGLVNLLVHAARLLGHLAAVANLTYEEYGSR